jgi:hypothetical protein
VVRIAAGFGVNATVENLLTSRITTRQGDLASRPPAQPIQVPGMGHKNAKFSAFFGLGRVVLACLLTVSVLPKYAEASTNSPAPPIVTLKKDKTVKLRKDGKKITDLLIRKGETLEVEGQTRSGFIVKKGDFDKFELKKYEVERIEKVDKIDDQSQKNDPFSTNYPSPRPKLKKMRDVEVMVEDVWSDNKIPRRMYAWPGENVVFLTLTDDLDPEVMQKIMDALDIGWRFYKEAVGMSPHQTNLSRKFNGRGIFIAVPDHRFVGNNAALGYVGAIGIEVALFLENQFGSKGDYLKFKETGVLPDYYFYEMGRNYYLFDQSHSLFATGFAVAMSIICLDKVGEELKLPPQPRRELMREVEKSFSESGLLWKDSFTEFGAHGGIRLKNSQGRSLTSNLSDLYASMVLYLYDNHGGDAWLKKYLEIIALSPQSSPVIKDGKEGQILSMIIAASMAAQKDTSHLFKDRWRAPLTEDLYKALAEIDWQNSGYPEVLQKLPIEVLPTPHAATRPEFSKTLKPAEKVIRDPSFEETREKEWKSIQSSAAMLRSDLERRDAKEGRASVFLEGTPGRVGWYQELEVEGGKTYIISGWIKTENLITTSNANNEGAAISVGHDFRSPLMRGSGQWEYVGFPVKITATEKPRVELAVEGAIGKAYFDDLRIYEVQD